MIAFASHIRQETKMDGKLFDSSPDEAIVAGMCVMILDDRIVYAGPIKGAPDTSGRLVLLNPADFDRLKTIIEKKRH
jgi:hypothetical protein